MVGLTLCSRRTPQHLFGEHRDGAQRIARRAFDVFSAKVRRSNCRVGRCRDVPVNDKRSIAPDVYLNPYGMASTLSVDSRNATSRERLFSLLFASFVASARLSEILDHAFAIR